MNYRQPFILVVALSLLISFNYISAWTVPGANPPSGNVDAPINTGAVDQDKDGSISVTGSGSWVSAPTVLSNDTTATNWILIRGNEPSATSPSSDTVSLELDVNGDVGADRYCDRYGNNCTDAASLGGGSYGFGGMYSRNSSDNSCNTTNYYTSSCSCPAPFQARLAGDTGTLKFYYCSPTV